MWHMTSLAWALWTCRLRVRRMPAPFRVGAIRVHTFVETSNESLNTTTRDVRWVVARDLPCIIIILTLYNRTSQCQSGQLTGQQGGTQHCGESGARAHVVAGARPAPARPPPPASASPHGPTTSPRPQPLVLPPCLGSLPTLLPTHFIISTQHTKTCLTSMSPTPRRTRSRSSRHPAAGWT
jgi:hypothetical protein